MNTQISWSGGIEVACRGDEYARGFAQGSKLKAKIHVGIEHCLRQPEFRREQPWWMPYWLFRLVSRWKAYQLLAGPMKRDFPAMAQRLQGIADGAEIDIHTAYLVNAFEPLLSFVNDADVPSLSACSAVAVAPSRSKNGAPLLIHNFDYDPSVEPYITLRESIPESGYRAVEMTLAPLVGAVEGMNEKGLVIANNYAYTLGGGRPSGTMTMLISETLQRCATVEQALKHMTERSRWGGGIIMLMDASGDIASLEISTDRFQIRRPSDGILFHTNCYQTAAMRAVQVPERAVFTADDNPLRGRRVLQSAERRYARLAELLPKLDKIGPQDLESVMADHGPEGAEGDDTVCVHGKRSTTIATAQYLPGERLVRMSTGFACQAKFHEIRL